MMRFSFQLKEALFNLSVAKLRSLLAVLGILVGTAAVVAMVSGGQLASKQILAQFQSLGTDLLAVQLYYPKAGDYLSLDEILSLQQIPQVSAIAPYTSVFQTITFNDHPLQGNIMGATSSLLSMVKLSLLPQGRFVNRVDRYSPFAVIGSKIYQQIKRYSTDDIIGKQLKIGHNFFTIIGITQPWGANAFIFQDLNYAIIVPLQASTLLGKNVNIDNVIVKVQPNSNITRLEHRIKQQLQQRAAHTTIYFRSAQELIAHMKKQQNILTLFLGFIGSIALVVGGIGVMNIMLVCVAERRQEIGIRMAIGAKRLDIQLLFLIEAVMLSLLGGLLGIAFGVFIAWFIAVIKHWPFTLFLLPPTLGFTVSVAVGIFFGFYPAYKASKLNPIETLHAK